MPPGSLSQRGRPLAIATPLGEDVVGLRSMVVTEELGRLFQIEVKLSSLSSEINFNEIVGYPVSIRLEVSSDRTRFWHGIVRCFSFIGQGERFFHYRAVIVPALWTLTQSSDCRIFQTMSTPEVIQDVLRRAGLTDFELCLSGEYSKWEYCAQYGETQFDFINRLMEHEGIAYHFKQTEEKALLVLGDDHIAYDPISGFASLPYHAVSGETQEENTIYGWEATHQVRPTEYASKDYNFETPRNPLLCLAQVSREHGANDGKMFGYPGKHPTASEGERLAQIRLDELQAERDVATARTRCVGLAAGALFTLTDHPRPDQNREYLVTWLNLTYDAGEFSSDQADATKIDCWFRAVPADTRFRPTRITSRPRIQGPQTAMVVGPTDEEIYTDLFGRVKVHFHWDRHGVAGETSSCWVRVSQGAAGKGWGMISLPRVGQEVVVEFIEGDPDRPIVTGRVYNADAKVPYSLPAHKTLSAFKSSSSKGGEGFNEIRFEDKKGEEQLFIHAEKNHDLRIKSDSFESIGANQHLVVKKDQFEHIENNREEIVDADHKEKIGKDRHLKVIGKEAKSVGGSLSLTVKGDTIEVFKSDHSEQTTKDYSLKAENVVIEALTNLTLQVGKSYIAIEANGITLSTTGTLELDAKGSLSVKSLAQVEITSAQTSVSGDALVTILGGMVNIN